MTTTLMGDGLPRHKQIIYTYNKVPGLGENEKY